LNAINQGPGNVALQHSGGEILGAGQGHQNWHEVHYIERKKYARCTVVDIVKFGYVNPPERKIRGSAIGAQTKKNSSGKFIIVQLPLSRRRPGKLSGLENNVATTAIKAVQVASAISAPQERPLTRFKAAFGALKDRKAFGDDAIAFQREMREEWQ
jgi:hypothetical protein